MAYTGIASTVISGTSTTTTTFSSIPQTYKDLILRVSYNTTTGTACLVTWNGIGSSYAYLNFLGTTLTNITTNTFLSIVSSPGSSYPNKFSIAELSINNYAQTALRKHFSSTGTYYNPGTTAYTLVNNEGDTGSTIAAAAVTSLTIACGGGAFASGTRFDLYGVS